MTTWTPAPAWVQAVAPIMTAPATSTPQAAEPATSMYWSADDLKAALSAASDDPQAPSVTKRPPHLIFQLSPALPNWDGRPGRYATRCATHDVYTLCPTLTSARTWRDTAAFWCPECIA